ncbi:hypothetical protein Golob_027986 [Gossypium lobatum]|uniref:Uncharacterized protein n=1 Tax=Gossypium lobatum TaxID=34289 RepID=A0A7J8NGK4_9ROSI|nr:hypothetical protein [Gossypium lobatum]
MGFRLPAVIQSSRQLLKHHSGFSRKQSDVVPKGHVAVYVGEAQRKRFVVPIAYLNHPSFKELLNRSEEEFGFDHQMGGLTIPCKEDAFINLTSKLHTCLPHQR